MNSSEANIKSIAADTFVKVDTSMSGSISLSEFKRAVLSSQLTSGYDAVCTCTSCPISALIDLASIQQPAAAPLATLDRHCSQLAHAMHTPCRLLYTTTVA